MVDRCRQPPSATCERACDRPRTPRGRRLSPLTGSVRLRIPPAVSGALRADEQLFEDGVVDVPSEEARRSERPAAAEVAEMDL